jgi:hypothetical protein
MNFTRLELVISGSGVVHRYPCETLHGFSLGRSPASTLRECTPQEITMVRSRSGLTERDSSDSMPQWTCGGFSRLCIRTLALAIRSQKYAPPC